MTEKENRLQVIRDEMLDLLDNNDRINTEHY